MIKSVIDHLNKLNSEDKLIQATANIYVDNNIEEYNTWLSENAFELANTDEARKQFFLARAKESIK